MLPHWNPEVTLGNVMTITLILYGYYKLTARGEKILGLSEKTNDVAVLGAGHAQLGFLVATENAAKIQEAVHQTVAASNENMQVMKNDIIGGVGALAADVAYTLAQQTPAGGIVFPPELKVVIATELKDPPHLIAARP